MEVCGVRGCDVLLTGWKATQCVSVMWTEWRLTTSMPSLGVDSTTLLCENSPWAAPQSDWHPDRALLACVRSWRPPSAPAAGCSGSNPALRWSLPRRGSSGTAPGGQWASVWWSSPGTALGENTQRCLALTLKEEGCILTPNGWLQYCGARELYGTRKHHTLEPFKWNQAQGNFHRLFRKSIPFMQKQPNFTPEFMIFLIHRRTLWMTLSGSTKVSHSN